MYCIAIDNPKQKAYNDKKKTCDTSPDFIERHSTRCRKKKFLVPVPPRSWMFSRNDMSNRGTHVRVLVDIKFSRTLSHRNFYLPFFIAHYHRIRLFHPSSWFFCSFGSGEPLNRVRWHNGRSRQSPTCYHRCRQRIVKPRIVQQLRVTPRVRRSSLRTKIAATRWVGTISDWITRIFFRILVIYSGEKKKKISYQL